MTPDQASTLAAHLLPAIEMESEITRRVIAAVPEDKSDYRIHPQSRTALELAWHIAEQEIWFLDSIFQGQFFAGTSNKLPVEIKSVADVLAWYDAQLLIHLDKLAKLSGEYLARPMNFLKRSDYPAVIYLQLMLTHTVHHRGQLAAYLRAMGAKVPRIYGGSLDEPIESHPAD